MKTNMTKKRVKKIKKTKQKKIATRGIEVYIFTNNDTLNIFCNPLSFFYE